MSAMEEEARLAAELAAWHDAGRKPRFFLRDDDAISDTPALRRLLRISSDNAMPLLLAAIPRDANPTLAKALSGHVLTTPAVHGYAHANHAPIGEKPCELGMHRPLEIVLGELRSARAHLQDLFDRPVSDLLVPPWNRVHDGVLAKCGEAGFEGVSAHGWEERDAARKAGLAMVNAHVDIIHWSGGRAGRTLDWVWSEIAGNLTIARTRGWRAVGILTHHLAHDDQAWLALESIASRLADADWVAADMLIEENRPQA